MITNEEMWKFRYMDNVRIVDKDGNVNVGSVIEILDGDEFGCDDELKLEQISDNQIRCMLTKNDLAQRQLKISELAYGSARARKLFQEMMHRASDEL